MSGYYHTGDDLETGMSSFTWMDNAPPPVTERTCRIVQAWRCLRIVHLTGLSREVADAAADGLNRLAQEYGQNDKYIVEEE